MYFIVHAAFVRIKLNDDDDNVFGGTLNLALSIYPLWTRGTKLIR